MKAVPPDDELSADEDWPASRGPHLPDALGALPIAAWIFVLLAVTRLAWGLREASVGSVVDPWRVAQVVLFEMPSVVSILLPAALLARHRDAPTRLRLLLIGMILLAIVEGLRILATPLEPVFEGLTPGDQAASFLVPSALVYLVATNLLNAGAVTAIGVGLGRARRYGDRSRTWPVSSVLVVLVVLVAVTGIVSVSRLPFDQLPLTPTVVSYIVSTVVLNVLSAAAFGFLAATATAGTRAAEEPGRGWRVAAAGSWLVIGSLAVLGLQGLVPVTPDNSAVMDTAVQVVEGVFSVGFIGLLGGFVLGLPALDALEGDEDIAFDDGDDEAVDDDGEAGVVLIEPGGRKAKPRGC